MEALALLITVDDEGLDPLAVDDVELRVCGWDANGATHGRRC